VASDPKSEHEVPADNTARLVDESHPRRVRKKAIVRSQARADAPAS
jgi:hypothetical protein